MNQNEPSPDVLKLAHAIKDFCSKHSRPNSVSPRELYLHHGGPRPTITGRIGLRHSVPLWLALGGREKWGTYPLYTERRFYL